MNDFYLIRKNLTRNKMRMSLNLFAIVIAFLLFGTLGAIKNAFDAGVELSADDRLVVTNKISFTQTMPVSYVNKIRAVEGAREVTWANWFGGYYQEPQNMAMTFAVDPESYLRVYPELRLDEKQRTNWLNNRQSVIIGKQMAMKFGWNVGDKIPLSSNIFSHKNGGHTWEVVIEGIFTADSKNIDTSYMLMHHLYFFESQSYGGEWIGWVVLLTDNPSINDRVSKAIDSLFENSAAETETNTEAAFNKAFIEQMGDIGFMITSVVLAAFFTILLIVGNSMMLSVRERVREIAVLKTLGFPSSRVFIMVLGESLLLACIGGILGLCLAEFIITGMSQTPKITSMFPNMAMDTATRVSAAGYMVVLGLLTGFFPALRALKLKTIDALSKG